MLHRSSIAAMLMVAAACAKATDHNPGVRALGAAADLTEGRYELCTFMHSEVLQLRNGRFEHRIETDIGPVSVTAGTYSVEQDRLQFAGAIDLTGRSNGLVRSLPPFVIDERGGKPVLWRTAAMKRRAEANGSVG